MAASVSIIRMYGSSPSTVDVTSGNVVANASDDHQTVASGSTNPIVIPVSGTNYSFWVTTKLVCSVTPDGTINNIKWYTGGANPFGTGITCVVAQASGYQQATGTVGTTGTELTTMNHSSLSGSPVDAFSYTSGSPLSITGSLSNPSTGDFSNPVVYQLAVASTAAAGVIAGATFTWSYDET